MKLNRTPNPLDRNTRNSDNENWNIIEGEFKKVDNTFGEVNDRVDNIIDEVSDDALKKVVDNAKLNWKEPVDNFNDLPSNAQIGDTRMDKSTGKVYRYDGANWVEIQQIDAGPVNELDSRISSQLNETDKSLNLKKANAQIPLDIPTYHFGDNHAVHPSIKDFPNKKYGFAYVMAFTPYSESRDRYENPSIVVSDDRINWYVPNGLINPVIPQLETGFHYSDPELFDNGTELEMWYRLTNKSNQQSKLLMVKTIDLINWTDPVTILEINQLDTAYISPTGFYASGIYHLWYRDKNANYVYTSTTDLINWTTPEIVNYDFGEYSNFKCWHNEVRVIDGKYMSVSSAIGDGEYQLFLFESSDGKNFDLIKKIVEPSLNGFDNWRIYKASLVKYGVWYYIYYSAFARDNSCHIGLTKASAASSIFSGYTMADKQFNDLYQMTTAIMYGRNKEPIIFPDGLRVSGKGETLVVNAGVAGYRTQPQKPDTMTILTDAGDKHGYLEVSGIILSDSNDSIQGVNISEGASYLDKSSKRLTIVRGNTKDKYARFANFLLSSNGSISQYQGGDVIGSVESVGFGVKINFKNMPPGRIPHVDVHFGASEGLVAGETGVGYFYIKEAGAGYVIVGLKNSRTASGHVPFNTVTSGTLRFCVIY